MSLYLVLPPSDPTSPLTYGTLQTRDVAAALVRMQCSVLVELCLIPNPSGTPLLFRPHLFPSADRRRSWAANLPKNTLFYPLAGVNRATAGRIVALPDAQACTAVRLLFEQDPQFFHRLMELCGGLTLPNENNNHNNNGGTIGNVPTGVDAAEVGTGDGGATAVMVEEGCGEGVGRPVGENDNSKGERESDVGDVGGVGGVAAEGNGDLGQWDGSERGVVEEGCGELVKSAGADATSPSNEPSPSLLSPNIDNNNDDDNIIDASSSSKDANETSDNDGNEDWGTALRNPKGKRRTVTIMKLWDTIGTLQGQIATFGHDLRAGIDALGTRMQGLEGRMDALERKIGYVNEEQSWLAEGYAARTMLAQMQTWKLDIVHSILPYKRNLNATIPDEIVSQFNHHTSLWLPPPLPGREANTAYTTGDTRMRMQTGWNGVQVDGFAKTSGINARTSPNASQSSLYVPEVFDGIVLAEVTRSTHLHNETYFHAPHKYPEVKAEGGRLVKLIAKLLQLEKQVIVADNYYGKKADDRVVVAAMLISKSFDGVSKADLDRLAGNVFGECGGGLVHLNDLFGKGRFALLGFQGERSRSVFCLIGCGGEARLVL